MPDPRAAGGERVPNPGSLEAIEAGCRCPVLSNRYGRGNGSKGGKPLFWFNAACPLHGDKSTESGERDNADS